MKSSAVDTQNRCIVRGKSCRRRKNKKWFRIRCCVVLNKYTFHVEADLVGGVRLKYGDFVVTLACIAAVTFFFN